MKNLNKTLIALAIALSLFACKTQVETVTKTATVTLTPEIVEQLQHLIDKERNGELVFYHDKDLNESYEYFNESYVTKEVLQIPDPAFPGEYKDTVLLFAFTAGQITSVSIEGEYDGDQLVNINKLNTHYDLIVEGVNLGNFPCFSVIGDDFNSNELIQLINN
ncbi:MAG: hypothetical protein KDC92_00955 [Bacteroidetes bacterium]|nr:hypothetical protein [Bacteroidota bacterium]